MPGTKGCARACTERSECDRQIWDAALLIASGDRPDSHRSLLGVSISLSEQEVHWRNFLQSLVSRDLSWVQLIISDDHAGLEKACKAVFGGIPWQRY
jgi:putative transposase